MEQRPVSQPIHIGKIITIGNSTPEPLKPLIALRGIGLKKLKLIVRTLKKPEQIVDEYLNYADKSTMIDLLSTFQKKQGEWDLFRKKIPDGLLDKWKKVMWECRKNGFIAPKIENSEIKWKVIMTLYTETCDQCTLCPTSWIAGDCKGRLKYKPNGERNWTPCWKINQGVPF